MVFALAGLFVVGSPARAVDLMLGSMKVNKILFLGNSITWHPYKSSINWYGTWGMAASSEDKDYVHVLTSKIASTVGGTPSIMAVNIADFETGFGTYNPTTSLQTEFAFKPDVIVLAVGENVTLGSAAAQTGYAGAYANLLNVLKSNTGATIFTRSCFWADTTKDQIMETATLAAGDYFVDMSALCKNPANYAYSDPTYANSTLYGVFNSHPGDNGMAAIAGLLYDSMVVHSVPEPGTVALLGMAGLCFGIAAWRRRCL